jgi:hypothetical protein
VSDLGQRIESVRRLAQDGVDDPAPLIDLLDGAATSGSDLRLIVRELGSGPGPVRIAVAFALSHASWNWTFPGEALCDAVLDFLDLALLDDSGTMVTALGAVQGLSARRLLLVSPERRPAIEMLLTHCLAQADPVVRGTALNVLGHLWADGTLAEAASAVGMADLRRRVANLAAEDDRGEFADELEELNGFWR